MKEDTEDIDLTKRIDELENSLSIALGINDKYQRENVAIRRRAEAAEADNKKLSQQVSDYIKKYENALRKAGM
jgi:cell division protein FtsB